MARIAGRRPWRRGGCTGRSLPDAWRQSLSPVAVSSAQWRAAKKRALYIHGFPCVAQEPSPCVSHCPSTPAVQLSGTIDAVAIGWKGLEKTQGYKKKKKGGGECLCLWGFSVSYCANDGEDPGACGRLCLHSAEGKERRVRVREAKASVDSRPPGSGCCACLLSPTGLPLNHSFPLQPRSGTHCQVGLFWIGVGRTQMQ